MKRSIILWVISFLITIFTAYYQRISGPTYPLGGKITIENEVINYKLLRSFGGEKNADIGIAVKDSSVQGFLKYKRFKSFDDYTTVPMKHVNGELTAALPHQPPAGKIEYQVQLVKGAGIYTLPENNYCVIRFKGDVPWFILIPHIIAMFGAMLLSTRTGLAIFNAEDNLKKLVYWTVGFLIAGGMILGPITQLYAFNALWTGIPFGYDLTDNKTLFALIGWLAALLALYKSKYPKRWAFGAAVVVLIIFLIPHSMLGSEIDHRAGKQETHLQK